MIEAGADEIPEDEILEAFEPRARRDREDLRRAGGSPPPGRQAEVPRSRAHFRARVAAHAGRIRERIEADGLREAGAVVEELVNELAPELSMESSEEDILRQIQVRSSLDVILERTRLEVVERYVHEQFETTCAR